MYGSTAASTSTWTGRNGRSATQQAGAALAEAVDDDETARGDVEDEPDSRQGSSDAKRSSHVASEIAGGTHLRATLSRTSITDVQEAPSEAAKRERLRRLSRASLHSLAPSTRAAIMSATGGSLPSTSSDPPMRTGTISIVSQVKPDELTAMILSRYDCPPTSSALQILDFSLQPSTFMLDTPASASASIPTSAAASTSASPTTPCATITTVNGFRNEILLSLDTLRGLLLAIMADESIQLFLRETREPDENWYSKQVRWTESPLYALRLLANPAAPGFILLGGIGIVLFQQTRLQLGWTMNRLLWYYASSAGILMIVNLLLTLDFTVREDGPTLVENLILFSFGIIVFLLGSTAVGLHAFERFMINKAAENPGTANGSQEGPQRDTTERTPLLGNRRADPSHAMPADSEEADDLRIATAVIKAESLAYTIGNVAVLVLVAALLALNMLAVPRLGTSFEDRSSWFWFWVMPNPAIPDMTSPEYRRLLSQYPPLNWLPFGLLGILYGRYLTRHARTRSALVSTSLLVAAACLLFFVLTRVLRFGNLSQHLLPTDPTRPDRNPYYLSWQAFLYTIKFPPDLAYTSLALGANALFFAGILCIKTEWKERLPLLVFGRTPVFFYATNLLVFRFVANIALAFFGLPPSLDLGPALGCYAGTLVITWFLCRGFVAFKDARSSPESFWRFF